MLQGGNPLQQLFVITFRHQADPIHDLAHFSFGQFGHLVPAVFGELLQLVEKGLPLLFAQLVLFLQFRGQFFGLLLGHGQGAEASQHGLFQ